jgi:hypothetical protein
MVDSTLTLVIYAIYIAIAYGLIGYVGGYLKNGEPFDFRRFASTIIYSIFVGFMGVYTGILNLSNVNFLSFDQLFASYVTILLVINKIVDGIWEWYNAKKVTGADVPCDFSVVPSTATIGVPITFTDATVSKLITLWNFGDGTLSNDIPSVTHTFKEAGTFKVGAVSTLNGKHGSHYADVIITDPNPTPTPPSPVIGYWAQLWQAVVSFINSIFGKKVLT